MTSCIDRPRSRPAVVLSRRGIPAPTGQKEGYLLSFRAKTRRSRRCPDAIAQLLHADPAKALVMTSIGQLVADGCAQWAMLDNGDIQLSLNTGETFLLTERVIIRLA